MIVADVETTGLDPQKHSIVSVGAIDFSNPRNQFYEECRIWEGAVIDPKALEINGFKEHELRDPSRKSLEKAVKEFFAWLESIHDRTLAGENPFFDNAFLAASAEMLGIKSKLGHRIVDLHSLCYSHHLKRGIPVPTANGRTDINLDKILAYVGLPKEPKPHRAINGARMEAEAFSRLIYGKCLLEEFRQYAILDYL